MLIERKPRNMTTVERHMAIPNLVNRTCGKNTRNLKTKTINISEIIFPQRILYKMDNYKKMHEQSLEINRTSVKSPKKINILLQKML